MIGIDTSVLISYVVQDPPRRAAKARTLIEGLTRHSQGFISLTVLVEVTQLLEAEYQADKTLIAEVVETLIREPALVVQDADQVRLALMRYQRREASFADCLAIEQGNAYGCHHTVTFDKASMKAGMQVMMTFETSKPVEA